eukprot:scaffold15034_cov181-Amphora_coffeaeformis.AAC.3
MNISTDFERAKSKRDEFGDPGAEDKAKPGITEDTWRGSKFIFTSKENTIVDGELYTFAATEAGIGI